MRQGPQIKRQRGRGQGGYQGGNQGNGGGGNTNRKPGSLRHQTFDSNGPDTRVRGTAIQVYEKYMSLARDATSSGDRVTAENYYQHAEHYYRIIASFSDGQPYVPQHMQQRDTFDFEQEEERGQQPANGADEAAGLDPASPDAPQPEVAAADPSRFEERRETGDRRDRREFRDRRGEREGFRPETRPETRLDNRTETRSEARGDLGDFNEQPAFLRQPVRRPRDENEPRESRRFDGDSRPRARAAYPQSYEAPAGGDQPSPVTVITPAGGGLPPLAEPLPPRPVPAPETVLAAAAPAPVAAPPPVIVPPVIVPIAAPAETPLPLDLPAPAPATEALPAASAETPAEPPKRKRGRPPKVKPVEDA